MVMERPPRVGSDSETAMPGPSRPLNFHHLEVFYAVAGHLNFNLGVMSGQHNGDQK